MLRNTRNAALTLAALCALPPAQAAVTVSDGWVDTRAAATVGNQGSSSGAQTDDPAVANGTGGVLTQTANVIAGPVAPGDLPTLPGTDRVISATSRAEVDYTVPGGISTALNLDFVEEASGTGGYSTNGIADARVEFDVDEPTDYELTGSYDVFESDPVWRLQLIGVGGALVNAATESGTSGDFTRSGTLQPGVSYVLRTTINGSFGTGELGAEQRASINGTLMFLGDGGPGTDPDPEPDETVELPAAALPVIGVGAVLLCAVAGRLRRRLR